jgi:hypothetical protein
MKARQGWGLMNRHPASDLNPIRTRWNSTSYHPPTVTANEGEILLGATAPLAAPTEPDGDRTFETGRR